MTDELISRTTRGLFRSLTTGSTVGEIAAAFQDEGFAPNPDCAYEDSSVRRQTTQAYLDAIDWTDPRHVARALRAFGRLMNSFEAQYTEQLRHSLRRDGYVTDSATGHIMSAGPQFAAGTLAGTLSRNARLTCTNASRGCHERTHSTGSSSGAGPRPGPRRGPNQGPSRVLAVSSQR